MHEFAQREQVIEKLRAQGVEIPCADGVLIGERVTVGAGTFIYPGTILKGETVVGQGCVLGPNTLVEDCTIGDGVRLNASQLYRSVVEDGVDIGPFCHIRPGSRIRRGVHIGDFVEIKNSDLGAGTKVAHLTYVGDSDVGERVNFGCGVVTVNYDGNQKSRTTIGDDAFIGCNTNLVAPVTVGAGSYTAAGSTITEDLPPDALGIARARQQNKAGWAAEHRKRK